MERVRLAGGASDLDVYARFCEDVYAGELPARRYTEFAAVLKASGVVPEEASVASVSMRWALGDSTDPKLRLNGSGEIPVSVIVYPIYAHRPGLEPSSARQLREWSGEPHAIFEVSERCASARVTAVLVGAAGFVVGQCGDDGNVILM